MWRTDPDYRKNEMTFELFFFSKEKMKRQEKEVLCLLWGFWSTWTDRVRAGWWPWRPAVKNTCASLLDSHQTWGNTWKTRHRRVIMQYIFSDELHRHIAFLMECKVSWLYIGRTVGIISTNYAFHPSKQLICIQFFTHHACTTRLWGWLCKEMGAHRCCVRLSSYAQLFCSSSC